MVIRDPIRALRQGEPIARPIIRAERLFTPDPTQRRRRRTIRETIKRARKKRAKLPRPLRILTSLKTTAILGGALAFAAAPAAAAARIGTTLFGSPLRILGATTLAGALTASPTLRSVVLDPEATFLRGTGLGGLIEDPSPLRGIGKPRDIADIFKVAGLIGGTAAVAAGAVAVGKKVLERRAREPDVIGITPAISTTAFTPLAPVQQPPTPSDEKIAVAVEPQKPVKITNTFKPNIDISFRKSKKFINQQNLIR